MNRFNKRLRSQGSALLLTLLFLVGVGGTILTVSRLVLETSRVGANSDDYQVASRAADSAIQAGIIYLNANPPGADNVGLQDGPFTQGFKNSSCDALTAPDPSNNPPAALGFGCPWFALLVTPDITQDVPGSVILSDSDLPLRTPVDFLVTSQNGGLLMIPSLAQGSVSCVPYPSSICTQPTFGGGSTIQIPVGADHIPLRLTRTGTLKGYGIVTNDPGIVFTRLNYDCVSGIGYSGNVSVYKRLVRLYNPDDSYADTLLEGSVCSDHF